MGNKPSILQPNKKLVLACSEGNKEQVEECIDKGANVNYKGEEGAPLHYATRNGHVDVVRLLLSNGADVNAGTNKKFENTALHEACRRGKVGVVQALLAKGADPEAKDVNGKTPHDVALAADHGYGMIITKELLGDKAPKAPEPEKPKEKESVCGC